jgi:hypothetical protein
VRFVSQYSGFTVGVQSERRRLDMDGGSVVTRPGVWAEFTNAAMNQRDLEVALGAFQFKGLFQYEDEATPVSPAYRIGVYDTDDQYERRLDTDEEWTPEFKALLEQRMLAAPSYGRAFVLVPEQTMDPPWPKYPAGDDVDATELVLTIHNVIGIPFEDVLAYEESKFGERREDVIVALRNAIEVRDEGKVIVSG